MGIHVKYPLFLPEFNETWKFLDRISKNAQKQNFIKIRPVGAMLLHADGWTDGQTDRDMSKLRVAFCNFANASKKAGLLSNLLSKALNCIKQSLLPAVFYVNRY
jgi:hypothetical protein